MDTTHTRTTFVRAAVLAGAAATARRSRQMLIVLALALGAILLALSAPVVHAAPEDGHDTENSQNVPPGQTSQAQPLKIYASENPVVFQLFQTTKTITLTWTPQLDSNVVVNFYDNVNLLLNKEMDKGSSNLDVTVTYGKSYMAEVCRYDGVLHYPCAKVHIATEQAEIATPVPQPQPQPPGINLPLIPRLPDPAVGGTRR